MAEEISNIKPIEFSKELEYDSQEKEIIRTLKGIDNCLSDMFIGAVRVLIDEHNPDRFSQAANSMREITTILLRRHNQKSKLTKVEREKIKGIEKAFEAALEKMPHPKEKQEKKAEIKHIKDEFEKIKEILVRGRINFKLRIGAFIESNHPGYTKPLIEIYTKKWFRCNKFFVGKCVHHGDRDINIKEFMEHWLSFKDCLSFALQQFLKDDAPKLDLLLNMKTPPRS